MWQHGVSKGDNAAKVQLIRTIPVSHGGCCEWLRGRPTGIRHANIDMSKAVVNRLDELAHAIIFCNVKGLGIDIDAVQGSCFLCGLVK
jgi:hypothetical protein